MNMTTTDWENVNYKTMKEAATGKATEPAIVFNSIDAFQYLSPEGDTLQVAQFAEGGPIRQRRLSPVVTLTQSPIDALLTSPSVGTACEASGITLQAMYDNLSDPTFVETLQQHQDAILTALTAALVGLSGQAIATLKEMLDNPKVEDSIRSRIALAWLTQMMHQMEVAELARRVSKLEHNTVVDAPVQ